jgi:hypothetical protein
MKMKIIDKLKNNYITARDKELAAKREKAAYAAKKDLQFSDEDIAEIVKLIGEQNPSWAELDPDIMKLMLKLAIKQYKPKEEDFDINDKDGIRQKVADIFNTSDKVGFNFGGETLRPNMVTSTQIKQLNDAYSRGKGMGSGFKKALGAAFKKKTKNL